MNKREVAKYIEYTNLSQLATKEDIAKMCEEATKSGMGAICVNPKYVEYARMCLDDLESKVKLSTVISYPLGESTQEIKAMEAVMAKEAGADELDVVVSMSAIVTGNMDYVNEEVKRIVDCTGLPTKVVVEASKLTEEQLVKLCEAIIDAGAKYISVSTGYGNEVATQEAVKAMADMVAGVCEVKASGGIDNIEALYDMICAGATRIGTSSATKILDQFSK